MGKAKTVAQRRREKKLGRPRLNVPYREPNGRASRAREPADRVALEARAKHLGIPLTLARDQKAETFIGYLALLGPKDGLSDRQYEAATKYLDLRADYLKAIKAPNALVDNGAGGIPGDFISDEYIEWCADVKEEYDRCRTAILEAQAENRMENLFAALDYCIIRGERLHNLVGATRLVCNALARHFRC